MIRTILTVILVGLWGVIAGSKPALSQDVAPPNAAARVIVVDASGSMVAKNFNSSTTTRIEIAQQVLIEVYNRLLEIDDDVPTSTLVFGAEYSWQTEKNRNNWQSAFDARTLNHPICRDSVLRIPSSVVTQQSAEQAQDLAQSLRPSGMTPIHVSLLEGLRAFRGDIQDKTLQFVLISDMDEPNCLREEIDQCEALLPELSRITALGGNVSAIVFETPSSKVLQTFDECLNVRRVPIPVTNPNIPRVVQDAFETLEVIPSFIAAGPNNLDPNGVDPTTARIRFTEAGKTIPFASGPYGPFQMPEGEFTITGSIDATTFSETVRISSDGDVPVVVDPGELLIFARGAPGAVIAEVIISRPFGSIVEKIQNYKSGSPLKLANGTYNISAKLPNGDTGEGSVQLRLGTTRELTLDFSGAPRPQAPSRREVLLDVRFGNPTLEVSGVWPPIVTLVGPDQSGRSLTLSSSGYAGQLEFGRYQVEIASNDPHEIPITVAPGDGPMKVQLLVPAGWFTAYSPTGAPGSFELRDNKDETLYRLDGERLQHALPDGDYSLVYLANDGREVKRSFSIRVGREVLINDF